MICIYAIAQVKPGCQADFIKIADSLINHSRGELGNIRYHLAKESDTRYVFMEFWKDEEAVSFHMKAAHFVEAGEKLAHVLSAPLEIHKMPAVL